MDVRGGGQAADERHVQRANGYDSDGEEEGARGKPSTTGDTADVTGIGVSLFRAWEGVKFLHKDRVDSKPGTTGDTADVTGIGVSLCCARRGVRVAGQAHQHGRHTGNAVNSCPAKKKLQKVLWIAAQHCSQTYTAGVEGVVDEPIDAANSCLWVCQASTGDTAVLPASARAGTCLCRPGLPAEAQCH